jgi:hypothetical protein
LDVLGCLEVENLELAFKCLEKAMKVADDLSQVAHLGADKQTRRSENGKGGRYNVLSGGLVEVEEISGIGPPVMISAG